MALSRIIQLLLLLLVWNAINDNDTLHMGYTELSGPITTNRLVVATFQAFENEMNRNVYSIACAI